MHQTECCILYRHPFFITLLNYTNYFTAIRHHNKLAFYNTEQLYEFLVNLHPANSACLLRIPVVFFSVQIKMTQFIEVCILATHIKDRNEMLSLNTSC